MSPTIEKLPIPPLKLGEGPHWDIETQSLYLVDIENSVLLRYDPKINKSFSAKLDIPLAAFIIPINGEKNKFVVASGINLYIITWDGSSDKVEFVEHLCKLPNDKETNRINDGKCDPTGRLWFGTMSIADMFNEISGKLYSFSKEEGVREHASGIGVSNGLSWNDDMMYYNDSVVQSVDVFDYNSDGHIENRRVVFDYKKNDMNFFPDGMTIDEDGKLWVACFEGSQVINVDPNTGALLNKVSMPTRQITSAAWGGPNLEDLYITSGHIYADEVIPNGGCTFKVTGLPTKGLPMNKFKL